MIHPSPPSLPFPDIHQPSTPSRSSLLTKIHTRETVTVCYDFRFAEYASSLHLGGSRSLRELLQTCTAQNPLQAAAPDFFFNNIQAAPPPS